MCQPLLRMKENDRVVEWEKGLPSNEDLTPLTQTLITPILASAFIIKQQPTRTLADVNELSHATLAALQRRSNALPSLDAYPSYEEHTSVVGGPGFGYSNGRRAGGAANDAAAGSASAAERSGGGPAGAALGRDGRPGGAFQPPYREVPYVSTSMQLGVSSSTYMEAQAQGQGGQDHQRDSPGRGHSAGHSQGGQSRHERDTADARSEQPAAAMPLGGNLPFSSYERRPDSGSYGGGADSSKAGSGGSAPKKARKMTDADSEDGDSGGGPENSNEEPNARTLKRPRLVWTPQLHKRFVDAVGHLGIKNAVPKTIMQLMNVEGLTRENVASHLQKYRLYLKRMQGLPTDGPGSNDQLFASTPLPPNLGGSPLFMANHREDVVAPAYPPGVAIPHIGLGPPLTMGHYSAYEHHPYSGFARVPTQRSPSADHSHSHSHSHSHNHNHSHSHYSHSHHANHNHGQSSHHSHQSHHRDHRDNREFVVDSHSQPSSPPRRILTLFPTSSN